MNNSNFTSHESLAEIVSRYDGFILDQFGVMHNGKEALPGAAECVEQLFTQGKKLIILSNTSSPSETALSKLPKMGFDRNFIEGAVTSGEEAGRYIRETYGRKDGDDSIKKKAIWFTWAKEPVSPLPFLEKCGDIVVTNDAEEADFVIAHGAGVIWDDCNTQSMYSLGSFIDDGDMSRISPVLEECKERGLPMVCANPDYIMIRPDGSTGHMPGKIARQYEKIGGKCTYFGKPHTEHFQACLKKLGLDPSRVAHVGDSLHHDVAGANSAGIASVFITGGIHSKDLGGCELGVLPEESKLNDLFQAHGQVPSHVLPLFRF